MMRYLLPLAVFVAMTGLLYKGLDLNPRDVPSPLIGKPMPQFELGRLRDPDSSFGSKDLAGQVSLVNVWATWCVSCRAEHPLLVQLARSGQVKIYGLNYKDERPAAIRWLDELGDPYVANAFDPDGRVGIDWGVYGTPETFVIDKQGIIRHKHTGPITPQSWQQELQPLLARLEQES